MKRHGLGSVVSLACRVLTEGRGDLATQGQLVGSELMGQEAAQQAVERAQSARRGRFQQGGGIVTGQQGVSGAGSAATR